MLKYILFLVLIVIGIFIAFFIWEKAKDFSNRIQLIISFLTLLAACFAGVFTYIKYEDYRRESNYQKVIIRYLDNNVDVVASEMSHYIMKVGTVLMLYCDDKCNLGDITQREKIYTLCVQDSQNFTASLIRLSVFDTSLLLSCTNVFITARSVLRLMLEENVSKKAVQNDSNLIEPFYRFVMYNLQDLDELIRKDTAIYNFPNIEVIKNKKKIKFEEIINRCKEFNVLFDDGRGLNDKNKRRILLDYIANYLKAKGIPVEVKETVPQ